MSADRVTAQDVARRAGVPQSTVRIVLASPPGQTVGPVISARVREAAAELGYAPPPTAVVLRTPVNLTVLVVLPDVPLSATGVSVMDTLGAVLDEYGYAVTYQRRRGRGVGALLRAVGPAAMVCLGAFTAQELAGGDVGGVPVVGLALDGEAGHVTRISQHRVGRIQAAHLADRGHTRLAYAVSVDPLTAPIWRGRLEGVRAECAARGLPDPFVVDLALHPGAAERTVRRLLDRTPPVTAVCAYDDEVAFAILTGMGAVGVSAPDGLAVIGVEDLPLARLASPPITTVVVHTAEVGAALARHVLNRLRRDLVPAEPGDEPPISVVTRATT